MKHHFTTQHSELTLTDEQVGFIQDIYLGRSYLTLEEKVDRFVVACMAHMIEPMDILKLLVPFEAEFTESKADSKIEILDDHAAGIAPLYFDTYARKGSNLLRSITKAEPKE